MRIGGVCLRCRGQLIHREGEYGHELTCLQCSHEPPGASGQTADLRRTARDEATISDRESVYRFIVGRLAVGAQPKYEEIAADVGISAARAEKYVGMLVTWGYLRRTYTGHRTSMALPRSSRAGTEVA